MTDDLRTLIATFDPAIPIAEASTPPSRWYTDPTLAQLERDTVLRHGWLPVAHVDQVRDAGAYVAGCDLGIPWVVVRDGDVLRAFHNVCRHKAGPVAVGTGTTDALVCSYHGWRYGLDGALTSAPRMAGVKHLDPATRALPALGLSTWGPLVMVHIDPARSTPASAFPEVDQALADTDWRHLMFASRQTYDLACNWKVFVDNYLDGGYHIARVHPGLDAQLDMTGYQTTCFDRSSIQRAPASPGGAGRIATGAVYAWLYPNLMINRYGPVLDTNWVVPLSPSRCRVVIDVYFDASVAGDAAFVAASLASTDQTQREDVAISEQVQRGLASPSYDRGPYAPRVQHAEHHFHRLLAADLASAVC